MDTKRKEKRNAKTHTESTSARGAPGSFRGQQRPGFWGVAYLQLCQGGQETYTSGTGRMSFRPNNFAVCQYELRGNLLSSLIARGQASFNLSVHTRRYQSLSSS